MVVYNKKGKLSKFVSKSALTYAYTSPNIKIRLNKMNMCGGSEMIGESRLIIISQAIWDRDLFQTKEATLEVFSQSV